MGRKKNRKEIPPVMRRKLDELVSKLLRKCSSAHSDDFNVNWKDYLEIVSIVEEITTIEKDSCKLFDKVSNRDEDWNEFTKWCKQKKIFSDSTSPCFYPEAGYGLQAKHRIKEDDLIIEVPREAMLSTEAALKSKLGPLIKRNPILQKMLNVVLSLYLLHEYSDPLTDWLPYFKILPTEYNTVLYFKTSEIDLMKGSPVQEEALKLMKNISRQYAYFYQVFSTDPEYRHTPLRKNFTYDNYRWAVSTVMTRQNTIPSSGGEGNIMALIPMWDMCNHNFGKMSTDYNESGNKCECYAMKDFEEGSQVFICYGQRTNAEYFLHNGFVYLDNENDSLMIKLGISKTDSCYDSKCKLLSNLGIQKSGNFPLNERSKPLLNDTLKFLQIFLFQKDKIEDYKNLKEIPECTIEEMTNIFAFLKTRCMLLLRTYSTSLKEDEDMLDEKQFDSMNARSSILLRISEKRILNSHALS